jgi:hypothetical protein
VGLTPVQERTLVELMASRAERHVFPRELPDRLRNELEARMQPVAPMIDPAEPIIVSKSALSELHQRCEGLFVANRREAEPFAYGPQLALGKIVHKSVEVGVYATGLSEAELVERSIERLREDDSAFDDFMGGMDAVRAAELEGEAVRQVVQFRSLFPPLERAWTPAVELTLKAELLEGRVLLWARPDLCLGGANESEPMEARRLLLELKTGSARSEHDEDVRFYALAATLRHGVPPFRVATVVLRDGSWVAQDVTEEMLESAARRVADGVIRAVAVLDGTEPVLRPGPWCSWCPRRATCPQSAA